MGVQTKLTEKDSDNLELGILQWRSNGFFKGKLLFCQGFKGVPSFSKGAELFSGVVDKMLFSRETYRPYPTSVPAHALIFLELFSSPPFYCVETHCT